MDERGGPDPPRARAEVDAPLPRARRPAAALENGGPRHGPPTPPTLGAPRRSRGAPRYCDRLLALRARFLDVEHLRHRLRRVAQLEPVDTFQPIEDRLDAPSGLEDLFDPPASGGVHLLSEQLRLAHDDGQRIVDLVRGRGGEARDIPEGVALPDGRLD